MRLVQTDELARRWNEVEPLIARATALTNGCYEPVDLLTLAMVGRLAFWFVERDDALIAVATTEIQQLPRKRICDVSHIAGSDMASWIYLLLETMKRYAGDCGCHLLTAGGRPGWEKVEGLRMKRSAVFVADLMG